MRWDWICIVQNIPSTNEHKVFRKSKNKKKTNFCFVSKTLFFLSFAAFKFSSVQFLLFFTQNRQDKIRRKNNNFVFIINSIQFSVFGYYYIFSFIYQSSDGFYFIIFHRSLHQLTFACERTKTKINHNHKLNSIIDG